MFFLTRKLLLILLAALLISPVAFYFAWQKAAGLLGPRPDQGPPISVGVVMELSGPAASWGHGALKGVQMAVDQTNKRGGINGQAIELVVTDANEASTVEKLVLKQNESPIRAMIGPVTPSKGELIAKTFPQIPVMSLATHPTIPNLGQLVFQASYDDRLQGIAAAKFAARRWPNRSVILAEEGSAYAKVLTEAFREEYQKLGGQVIDIFVYKREQQDFRSHLERIVKEKPQFVFMPGYTKEGRSFLRQAREAGISTPVLGADGLESLAKDLSTRDGENSDWGLFYVTPNLLPTREAAEFVNEYKKRYQEDPHPMALWSYDASLGLVRALKTEGALGDDQILAKELLSNEGWPITGGRMVMTSERNALRPMAVMQVANGVKLVEVLPGKN